MPASSISMLAIAVLLVIVAGVFACADAALGAVLPARVDGLRRAGRIGARQLAAVVAERARHINLLLLLRLTCELIATVLVTAVCLRAIASVWLAVLVAVLAMVVVSYVLIGVGPRTIGRQHPYSVGLGTAGVVRALGLVLGPLSRLLIAVGNAITPGRGFPEGPFFTELELRELVDMAGESGVVAEGERAMIQSVFELGDTIAREVMVPRTEIVWIEHTKSLRQALALCLRTGYTRIPVIGDSVDDIVGVVNLKDLAQGQLDARSNSSTDERRRTVGAVMSAAGFVPETKRLDALLRQMQTERTHLVIVVDEYGGTAGLVTIEDVIEEIVGEITDESDTEVAAPIERLPDGVVRASSRLPVEDLGELFGIEIEFDEHDVETVGGLLAQRLGRVPLPGAEAEIAGLRLRAEGGKDRRGRVRISSVLVRRVDDDNRAGNDTKAKQDNGKQETSERDRQDQH